MANLAALLLLYPAGVARPARPSRSGSRACSSVSHPMEKSPA